MNYKNLKSVSALSVTTSMLIFFISSSVLAENYQLSTKKLLVTSIKNEKPTAISKVECSIFFGYGGVRSPRIILKNNKTTKINDIGGPWDFISATHGPCKFTVYNKNNFKGKKVNYGSDMSVTRVGAEGTDYLRGGGWRARSLIITPPKESACKITLHGKNSYKKDLYNISSRIRRENNQSFYGPSKLSDITGWSLVSKTSGNNNCTYTLYKNKNFTGRMAVVKKIDKNTRVGWKIRSIQISQQ